MSKLERLIYNELHVHRPGFWKPRSGIGEISFEDAIKAMHKNPHLSSWIKYTFLMVLSSYRCVTKHRMQNEHELVMASPSVDEFWKIIHAFGSCHYLVDDFSLGDLVNYGFPEGNSSEDKFKGYPPEGVFVDFFLKYKEKDILMSTDSSRENAEYQEFANMRVLCANLIITETTDRRAKNQSELGKN